MAGSFNRVTLVGNLGRDPEMRYLPNGDPVTEFSVATTDRWRTRDGQQQEQTTWFRVNAFGKLAETCNSFLHKGSYVFVEGTLSQRDWTDRDGKTRSSLEVRARDMRMLDRRGDTGELGAEAAGGGPNPSAPVADDSNMDDIPF